MSLQKKKSVIVFVREYSIPLIAGVVLAVLWKNISPASYEQVVFTPFFGEEANLHFFVNDIFMAFFFTVAAIEIVYSLSPGGSLNPVGRAIAPLMATAGGVIGPIIVFFSLNAVVGSPEYSNGWGVCTATDIALAWLLARLVFGAKHPAVSFLLLLAVVDDGIGLVIIAVFYPDPNHPTEFIWLLFILVGMALAWLLRRFKVLHWPIYLLGAGAFAWFGLYRAHLHPALALVFIVPFMPNESHIMPDANIDEEWNIHDRDDELERRSPIADCENHLSPFVDFGLFFFGLTNAGVGFSQISNLTWIIFLSLIVGKTVGIVGMTLLSLKFKCALSEGIGIKELICIGAVGGMGLTVALFVADAAFTTVAGESAKMGALFTAAVFIIVPVLGKIFRIKRISGSEDTRAVE